ncbi:MAG: alanine--tRNA ligase, partial [Alphaproteobacteria bacterium]
ERMGTVLQGKHDVFATDLLRALIEASAQATASDPDGPGAVHHRVIADHLRSSSFLIADGVMPSNEGRGYVLRRIMRRAMRHAHLLGSREAVMHRLVPELVRQMGQAFPELTRAEPIITETLRLEESRFRDTLDRGLHLLAEEVARLPEGGTLPGETAFRLYDTFGFPLDLTQDALRESGHKVDLEGFERAMAEQRARARAAWSGSGEAASEALWFDLAEELGATEFLGYETESAEGQILRILAGDRAVDSAEAGEEVTLILNQTPFYAESGGQLGDRGVIETETGRVRVTDTRAHQGLHAHIGLIEEGRIALQQSARLTVDPGWRSPVRANHSATHLLHEALRRVLGDHVAQRGSLVAPDRLRFDFSHGKAMTADEIARVEREVNALIRQNAPVITRLMSPGEAQAQGARALFGEKYGDEVRVVSMGTRPEGESGPAGGIYSMELCGGTHVARTGDIGLFVITAESASAAGIRRIEALTGAAAFDHLQAQRQLLAETAALLRTRPGEVPERVRALMEDRRRLEGELADLRRRLAMGGGGGGAPAARDVAGIPFLARKLQGVSGKELRALIDAEKERLGSGAILLLSDTGGKVAIAAGVTADLATRISAVDIVRAAAAEMGGRGGGGRAEMAQAGGEDFARADAAIEAAERVLAESRAAV